MPKETLSVRFNISMGVIMDTFSRGIYVVRYELNRLRQQGWVLQSLVPAPLGLGDLQLIALLTREGQ